MNYATAKIISNWHWSFEWFSLEIMMWLFADCSSFPWQEDKQMCSPNGWIILAGWWILFECSIGSHGICETRELIFMIFIGDVVKKVLAWKKHCLKDEIFSLNCVNTWCFLQKMGMNQDWNEIYSNPFKSINYNFFAL